MKISVIIPVYNAEKCLEKCVDSVIAQTHTEWELILVDDGSKDKSADMVDCYAEKDCRIRAIHQENSGPGIARNRGMNEASGEYFVFLDSDDYIDNEYLSLLAIEAKKHDLVFIDVIQVTPTGKILAEEKMSRYMGWNKDKLLRCQMTGKIPWGGVRKAVSRALIQDNNIHYTNHVIGEEALYSFRTLSAAQDIGFIDAKPVYFYVNHEGSQSKSILDDPWGPVAQNLKEYTQNKGIYSKYASTINALFYTSLVISLDRIEQMYSGKERQEHIQKTIWRYKERIDQAVSTDLSSMSWKAKWFVPFLKRDIVFPVQLCSRMRNIVR